MEGWEPGDRDKETQDETATQSSPVCFTSSWHPWSGARKKMVKKGWVSALHDGPGPPGFSCSLADQLLRTTINVHWLRPVNDDGHDDVNLQLKIHMVIPICVILKKSRQICIFFGNWRYTEGTHMWIFSLRCLFWSHGHFYLFMFCTCPVMSCLYLTELRQWIMCLCIAAAPSPVHKAYFFSC